MGETRKDDFLGLDDKGWDRTYALAFDIEGLERSPEGGARRWWTRRRCAHRPPLFKKRPLISLRLVLLLLLSLFCGLRQSLQFHSLYARSLARSPLFYHGKAGSEARKKEERVARGTAAL